MPFDVGRLVIGEVWEFRRGDGIKFVGRVESHSKDTVYVHILKAPLSFITSTKWGPGEKVMIFRKEWTWHLPVV